nr:retrovirus-related Pol polyprotein from transposon TNT 1-94 [Tanacetum cinerariifolium]
MLVCWSAKKQTFVAMSSVEAEDAAAAGCCAQVLWIKSQLAYYDVLYDKVPIFCDNTSVIAISNNPMFHSRIKHIDIGYHFIRDHILKGDIELYFVPIDLQLADIFTKPLVKPSFTRLVAELGTVRAGLATLGLADKDKPYLTSTVLVKSLPLKLKYFSPIWKIFMQYIVKCLGGMQSLLPPSGEVNVDDAADKSLSSTFVQPIIQPKAPTAKNPKKKKISSSTQPKSLEASILTEVQDNQPKATDATKEKAEEQSLEFPSVEQLLDEVDNHNKAVQESSESPYDTKSEIMVVKSFLTRFVSGFETADSDNLLDNKVSTSDHIVQDDNASTKHMSLFDHICEEVSFLHSKLGDMESSLTRIKLSLPTLVTNALKEQLPNLLSDTLKYCLPLIIKYSPQTHILAVFEKFAKTQTQLNKKVIKKLNKKLNVAHVAQSNRFVILQKELSKVIRSKLQDVKDLLESAVIINETVKGEKKKKDENAILAPTQREHQTAENSVTPEPTLETQGVLAFKESAMVLYDFKENLVDLTGEQESKDDADLDKQPLSKRFKIMHPIPSKPQPSVKQFTDQLFGTRSSKFSPSSLEEPTPPRDESKENTKEKKRKRVEFVKEVFVTEDVRVDGMDRNLIPPPGVIPIQCFVISEPESGIFFMNRNTNIGFQRENEFHLAPTIKLIRLQNQIKVDSKDSKVMKGLSKCKASESNVRRIQVKDTVKEVEDHLKTYSSAGMDISWNGLCLNVQKSPKNRTISTQDQKPQRKAGSGSKFLANNLTMKLYLSKFQSLGTILAQRSKPKPSKVKCQKSKDQMCKFLKVTRRTEVAKLSKFKVKKGIQK